MMESSIEGDGMMKDLVIEAIEQIEQLYERRGPIAGLTTGFPDLDRLTGGRTQTSLDSFFVSNIIKRARKLSRL
jgi:replicative DNA helicase